MPPLAHVGPVVVVVDVVVVVVLVVDEVVVVDVVVVVVVLVDEVVVVDVVVVGKVLGVGTGAQMIFGVVTGSARLPNWSVKSRVAPGLVGHLTL